MFDCYAPTLSRRAPARLISTIEPARTAHCRSVTVAAALGMMSTFQGRMRTF